MSPLTILLTILILILSAMVLYYGIRCNNLKAQSDIRNVTKGEVLEKFGDGNQSLQNNAHTLDNLNAEFETIGKFSFLPTEEIPVGIVKPFLKNYRDFRRTGDNTETILFDWPKIIQAMIQTYGVTASQWADLSYWSDKGFIIYPANYGPSGNAGQHINQSTVIFQLAKKDTSTSNPNDWEAILNANNNVYNFGDLQPPKGKIT